MPEMVAVDGLVTWSEWDERLRGFHHKSLRKGQKGEVPDEVARHLELASQETDAYGRPVDGRPRLLSPDDYEAWTGIEAAKVDPVTALTDEQLQRMSPDELLAQMNQVPGLAQRVVDLENEREKPRKPILTHAERLLAAQKGDDVSLTTQEAHEPLVPAKD